MSERVWLSLGSNVDRSKNIRAAVHALREQFGELVLSRVYESEAVGFSGEPFYNLVVGLYSSAPVTGLMAQFRAIEAQQGRVRSGGRFAPRSIDIDLLTYGGWVLDEGGVQLPRSEITRYAFVLLPLSEVAGDEIHPLLQVSYRELWTDFDSDGQRLWPVELALYDDDLTAEAN